MSMENGHQVSNKSLLSNAGDYESHKVMLARRESSDINKTKASDSSSYVQRWQEFIGHAEQCSVDVGHLFDFQNWLQGRVFPGTNGLGLISMGWSNK